MKDKLNSNSAVKEEQVLKYNSPQEYKQFLDQIQIAHQNSALICFVGAGVSISQGYPNWNNYVEQLINYWTYHLNDLITTGIKVKSKDMQVLQALQQSSESNKRKVDIVQHIIKSYCDSNADIKKQLLNFEKAVFSDMEPLHPFNPILDELVQLQPIFITTNYDQQIQKSYEHAMGVKSKIVENISELEKLSRMPLNTTIHLHGIPETDPDFFVSSAQSYKKIYLEGQYQNTIKKFLRAKQNAVIIFIGCSMEEDEVLTLLDTKNEDIQCYALLKAEHYDFEVNKHKNKIIKDYYLNNYGVNVFYYGADFADLPKFIAEMIVDFQNYENYSMPPEQVRKILLSLDEEQVRKVVDTLLIKGKSELLTKISAEYLDESPQKQQEYLRILLTTNLFSQGYIHNAGQYVSILKLCEQCFTKLTEADQKTIIKMLTNIKSFNSIVEVVIFAILKQNIQSSECTETQKLTYYLEMIPFLFSDFTINLEIDDDDYRCLWLAEQLKNKEGDIEQLEQVKFHCNKAHSNYLAESLQIVDDEYPYGNYQRLNQHSEVIQLLEYCLRHHKIIDANNQLPKQLYQSKIIQRICVNLELQGYELENFGIDLGILIEAIDFENRYYGQEMNAFVNKHNLKTKQSEDYYSDVFGEVTTYWISEQSFFEVTPITTQAEIQELIIRLRGKQNEHEFGSKVEYTLEAQSKELVKVLNTEENWQTHQDLLLDFLEQLTSDLELVTKYEIAIESFFTFALTKQQLSVEIANPYLKMRFSESPLKITNEMQKILTLLVENSQSENNPVFVVLFEKVDVKNFHEPKGDYVILNEFINLDLGRYYDIIGKISEDLKRNFAPQIKKAILNHSQILQEYLIGKFWPLYEEGIVQCAITPHVFIGYSHNYYITNQMLSDFQPAVIQLLNAPEFADEFVIRNIIYTLIHVVVPSVSELDVTVVTQYRERLFITLLEIFLDDHEQNLQDSHLKLWIQWFLQNEKYVPRMISMIIRNIGKNSERTVLLIQYLEGMNTSTKVKLAGYELAYIYEIDKFSETDFEQIQQVVSILVRKGYIYFDNNTINSIETICEALNQAGYVDLLKNFIATFQQEMLATDMTKLKQHFLID